MDFLLPGKSSVLEGGKATDGLPYHCPQGYHGNEEKVLCLQVPWASIWTKVTSDWTNKYGVLSEPNQFLQTPQHEDVSATCQVPPMLGP